jgi:hypothetical protein
MVLALELLPIVFHELDHLLVDRLHIAHLDQLEPVVDTVGAHQAEVVLVLAVLHQALAVEVAEVLRKTVLMNQCLSIKQQCNMKKSM